MKNLNYILPALFLALQFGILHPAWAQSAAAAENWTLYENARFGYKLEYPKFFSVVVEPDNGDGAALQSEDGNLRLVVSGGWNVLEEDAETKLEGLLKQESQRKRLRDSFGEGWYRAVFSGSGKDGKEELYYEYGVIDEDRWASFILVYPKDEENRFEEITPRMDKSLALGQPDKQSEGSGDGSGAAGAKGTGTFSVKDGSVYKNGEIIPCEVFKMSDMIPEVFPKGFDNGIASWAVIGPGSSPAVTEAETGVWFFGQEGEFANFIPLKSASEYSDIAWSPSGDRFVLETGSGTEHEAFFSLYILPGSEKKNEFPGLRGELWWLEDGMRIAFTRRDGVRNEGSTDNQGYGLKLSAVLYDSSSGKETVLKEAAETQSFRFGGIWEGFIQINEEYVNSPKDWGDDEKIKRREIKVPVPKAR